MTAANSEVSLTLFFLSLRPKRSQKLEGAHTFRIVFCCCTDWAKFQAAAGDRPGGGMIRFVAGNQLLRAALVSAAAGFCPPFSGCGIADSGKQWR
jgi:hypothetical protein